MMEETARWAGQLPRARAGTVLLRRPASRRLDRDGR
jgi:hypothetical protein